MQIIRTSAELASLCQPPLDPELQTIMTPYAAAFEEFGDGLSADVLIIEDHDTLADTQHAYGRELVREGHFTFPVELITEHANFFEVVWIISDSGQGLVLVIAKAGDASLVEACRAALGDHSHLA